MLKLRDIASRVKFKLDDPDSTYVTDDYAMGFVADVYDWLFGKLQISGSQFDEQVVILPNVPAGTPDLSEFQLEGKPLVALIEPSMIRWRMPGQGAVYFQRADGPLDSPRDMPDGVPALNSWAWVKYVVKLSKFSTVLDLEITGRFLFDPLTSMEDTVAISMTANRVLSCKLASDIAKARNMPQTASTYAADADDAMDDLLIAVARARQATSERVGRISRTRNSSRITTGH